VHIAPYFLRLNLPGNVLEDDESSTTYDPSSSFLTVTLTKETKGQDFPDLDLLAKLLAPKPVQAHTQSNPVIEVIASRQAEDETDGEDEDLVNRTRALSLDRQNLTAEQREILKGTPINIVPSSSSLDLIFVQLLQMIGRCLKSSLNHCLICILQRRNAMVFWTYIPDTFGTLLIQQMKSMNLAQILKCFHPMSAEQGACSMRMRSGMRSITCKSFFFCHIGLSSM